MDIADVAQMARSSKGWQQRQDGATQFLRSFRPDVDYIQDQQILDTFFKESEKYGERMKAVEQRASRTILLELDDIRSSLPNSMPGDPAATTLIDRFLANAKTYTKMTYAAIDKCIGDGPETGTDESPVEILLSMRRRRDAERRAGSIEAIEEGEYPATLKRRYWLYIKPLEVDVRQERKREQEALASGRTFDEPAIKSVRQVKSKHVGKMVTVKAIITRACDPRPMANVVAFTCDSCGDELFLEVTSDAFLPLSECSSKKCQMARRRGKLMMQSRATKFNTFREIKVQELAEQVPRGGIPRILTAYLFDELASKAEVGDLVNISGIFLAKPFHGHRAEKSGPMGAPYLEATYIEHLKEHFAGKELTDEERREIADFCEYNAANGLSTFERLATSVCPAIYGHLDVKKALLLQLVGARTKNTYSGLRIRGDMHILLMGDPGVAKSQMLKWICSVTPRGVYTTGKGSSGVGLTASVVKDPWTGDMSIEGGAMVLADNGICCIDEFDKMEDGDKSSIHEAMEQQTISISKAGLNTALNTRASVLAAANPAYGRYDPERPALKNIDLPAALLSRFDVIFLMLDKPDIDTDERLAEHVTTLNMNTDKRGNALTLDDKDVEMTEGSADPHSADFIPVSAQFIKNYVTLTRQQEEPTLGHDVAAYISELYVSLRKNMSLDSDGTDRNDRDTISYITPRTLLSIMRLAITIAKVRFSRIISRDDVDEAARLMSVSKATLAHEPVDLPGGRHFRPSAVVEQPVGPFNGEGQEGVDSDEAIFRLIRQGCESNDGYMQWNHLVEQAREHGFTEAQVVHSTDHYGELSQVTLEGEGDDRQVFIF